jgi:hypothetical protein
VIEEASQVSSAYGIKLSGRVLAARVRGSLPVAIAMLLTVKAPQEIDVEKARAILEEAGRLTDKT